MPPAARLTDFHQCPLREGFVPHIGGPIIGPGAPSVLIGGRPAAVMGDTASCIGRPATITTGSATVLIEGRPAARLGDRTAHGGVVTQGAPTVLIGG